MSENARWKTEFWVKILTGPYRSVGKTNVPLEFFWVVLAVGSHMT